MIRWLVVFAVMIAGCVATMPDDDAMTADLACETARQAVQLRHIIKPTPKPESDACDNCGGTGKLGDGRITVKCPACNGTGKRPKSMPAKPAACVNGVCPQ